MENLNATTKLASEKNVHIFKETLIKRNFSSAFSYTGTSPVLFEDEAQFNCCGCIYNAVAVAAAGDSGEVGSGEAGPGCCGVWGSTRGLDTGPS